ncbi:MAG: hypothetical protein QOE57_1313 [Acidimicrobiaceae bacterium]|nr:hypothetical protein [Acidimicrobiaceae bacterium]
MRARHRLIAVASAIAFATLLFSPPAHAGDSPGHGGATPSPGNGTDQSAQSGSSSPGSSGGGGGGVQGSISCTFMPVPAGDPSNPSGSQGGVTRDGQVIPPNTPGTWVFEICRYRDLSLASLPRLTFLPPGRSVEPAQLLVEARSHLGLPAPPVQLSPAPDHWQYVQMPTWAWVPRSAWVPLTGSATAGPVSVTVVATPVKLVFSYQVKGDGSTATATCNGPGTAYDDQLALRENPQRPVLAPSPDCGWIWHQSSADTLDKKYTITAHTVYHTVWTIRGAPGGGDLGELGSFNTTFRVTVGEIQALNTAPN